MKFHLHWIAFCLSAFSLVIDSVECEEATQDKRWYSNLSIVVHHNGEANPCGSIASGSIDDDFIDALADAEDKYELETVLTDGLASLLEKDKSMCGSWVVDEDDDDTEFYYHSLYSHCDRGPDKTPILLDHDELIETQEDTLPCRFFTREGLRIQTLDQLKSMAQKAKMAPSQSCANPQDGDAQQPGNCDNADESLSPEIHLYATPAGRVFHFAPAFVGEIFELDHLTLLPDASKPIALKVLSTSPKVFDVLNVFTKEEADAVVQRALAETSPTYKIKRSTTSGTSNVGGNIYNKRTSENGFDTSGAVAMAVKKRIFEVLGYDDFWRGHDDGLQVLRYNLTTAYIPHMDYLTVSDTTVFNYDSAGVGGNRYATVLLYMTDIPENGGGETVFKQIWPESGKQQSRADALEELRASGDADRAGIQRGSWEEEMVADCRRKFTVKPYSGRAVLFYSQTPLGEEDTMSEHGGCPVLEGDKWAANLWVWNTPREGNPGAPENEGVEKPISSEVESVHAIFRNSGRDASMRDAELYFDEATYWGKLTAGADPLSSNTYEGHRWNVRVDGKVVKTFVIGSDAQQEFIV